MINKLKLFRRSVNCNTLNLHFVICNINFKVVVNYGFLFVFGAFALAVCSAQDSLYSRHNLLGVKRLYYIVVGTELKTENLIKGFALCSKHNDWSGGNLPDFSAYLPSVLFGKHYIKKHQIRSFVLEGINSLLSVICREHHIAFVFKIKL